MRRFQQYVTLILLLAALPVQVWAQAADEEAGQEARSMEFTYGVFLPAVEEDAISSFPMPWWFRSRL